MISNVTRSSAVNLNDKVAVTGTKTVYNSNQQVGGNPSVTIVEESNFEPTVTEITLEEAATIAKALNKDYISQEKYTIIGNINIVNGNNFVTDGTNSVQLYKGSVDGLHQDCGVTVTGNLTKYNSTIEIVNYEIDEIVNCTYTVTIPTFENGTVTASTTTNVEYGTTVTFTVTPNSGYKIEYAGIGTENKITDEQGEQTFEYVIKGNVTVNASFISENAEVVLTEKQATLDLSNKSNRTSFSTSEQVWQQNGIVLTNKKGSSTSNVADYAPPRFYASSNLNIVMSEGYAMKSIVFTCSGSSYATALKNSIGATDSNVETTISGSTVTVTFTETVTEFNIAKFTAQVRMGASIVVTYMG